jgi:hypothetical protein
MTKAALQNRIRELEERVVETPAHWTKIINENKSLKIECAHYKCERDHYMKEMYRLIDELRKLRGTI